MLSEVCLFCGHPVDSGDEHEYRKRFPKKVHSRMSHGAQRDKDGRWYHIFPWQCILAEEIAKENIELENDGSHIKG